VNPADSIRRRAFWTCALVALALGLLPLPHLLSLLRPDLLLLVVIWFAMMAPRSAGITAAWVSGLFLDACGGLVLGEHALAFVVIGFLVHRFHLRMRMFPLLHQSLVVLVLLWLYQFMLFWIDGVTGHALNEWARLLPALTGALFWPVLTGLLGSLTARR
jgi:rod shape-determining protein MreD